MLIRITCFFLLAITLENCSSLQNQAPMEYSDAYNVDRSESLDGKMSVNRTFGDFSHRTFLPKLPKNLNFGEYRKLVKQARQRGLPELMKFDQLETYLIGNITSWQEAHTKVADYINETQDSFFVIMDHQDIAVAMIKNCLLLQQPTTDVQKAIEFYLAVLEHYNNYGEAYIYAHSLPMLYKYWSDEKISSIASKVINSSTKNDWVTANTWPPLLEKFYRSKLPEYPTLAKSDVQYNYKIQQIKQKFWQEDIMKFPKFHSVRDIHYELGFGIKPETYATLFFMAEGKVKQ